MNNEQEIIEQIIADAIELRKKLDEVRDIPDRVGEAEQLLRKMVENFALAEKWAQRKPGVPLYYKLFFTIMTDSTIQDARLFEAKNQFNEQISRIMTRLDNLETEVKKLKDKRDDDDDEEDGRGFS